MSGAKNLWKWALPILFFLAISFDGKTHWDETNYLYKGAYASISLDSSWLADNPFYQVRIAHICLLKLLFLISGVGLSGLVLVEFVMALMVLGAGILFYLSLGNLFHPKNRGEYFAVFLAFLFAPLSLYLSFKALGETTGLFFTSLAIYLYIRSLGSEKINSRWFIIGSAVSLFWAANAREASLLAFFSVAFPAVFFFSGDRKAAFLKLVCLGLCWLALFLALGLTTGLWCISHLLTRNEKYAANMLTDLADYPSNVVGLALFAGSFVIFILAALTQWRHRPTRYALIVAALVIVPLTAHATHIETRFLSSAIFGYALLTGIGLEAICQWSRRRIGLRLGPALAAAVFILAVLANELTVIPLQETGTDGIPLVRLINRTLKEYPDPLLLTAHPHSTYAFLRICYPEMRIALDRDFEQMAPIRVDNQEDLENLAGPRLYLSSRGPKPRSLLTRLRHRLQGYTPPERTGSSLIVTPWVAGAVGLQLGPLDREGEYIVFNLLSAEE